MTPESLHASRLDLAIRIHEYTRSDLVVLARHIRIVLGALVTGAGIVAFGFALVLGGSIP